MINIRLTSLQRVQERNRLQLAQEHNREFAKAHAEIVDSLRKQGVDREDAVEMADSIESRLLLRKEGVL